jgi:hypothetical protein
VRPSGFLNSGAKVQVLTQTLKPHHFGRIVARLKSCPDTKQNRAEYSRRLIAERKVVDRWTNLGPMTKSSPIPYRWLPVLPF